MAYLPTANGIIIAGGKFSLLLLLHFLLLGRNDGLCSLNKTPLLNDIFMFNLLNKNWYHVRYTEGSERLDHITNHSLAVFSDGESYERMVIFGGLVNKPSQQIADVKSFLGNTTFVLQKFGDRHGNNPPPEDSNTMRSTGKDTQKKLLNIIENAGTRSPPRKAA